MNTLIRPALRRPHRLLGTTIGLFALVTAASGCVGPPRTWRVNGWFTDYEAAERDAAASDRPLLIAYFDDRSGRDDTFEQAMSADAVKDRAAGFVRCHLFRSHEPDRRYVAQFGVHRAPALIVARRDATCHALTGGLNVPGIEAFLAKASETSGRPTTEDAFVPRDAEPAWLDSVDAAERTSATDGRPMLVVYHRTLLGDWGTLSEMLARPEVRLRLSGLTPARIGIFGWSGEAYTTQFGALRLPALVVAKRDGTFASLERPRSYEDLVRFLDGATATTPSAAAILAPTAAGGADSRSAP